MVQSSMKRALIVTAIAVFALTASVRAQNSDKLLETLKKELSYNFGELKKQSVKPYFMSYRVQDTHLNTISSTFGVVQTSQAAHQRTITPQIRVGDVSLDNFKFSTQGATQNNRQSPSVMLPYEDDAYDAIRAKIWTATIDRYRFAETAYEQALGKAATSTGNEDKAACFSSAPVEQYYEAAPTEQEISIDTAAWKRKLNKVSAVFNGNSLLDQGNATLNFEAIRTWFVNTEGTSVVQNRIAARLMLEVRTVASDGMKLSLHKDFFSYHIDSLPSVDSLIVVAKDLEKRVIALRNAPVANPYTGPAILSGPASGVFFHEIFGHRLEGHRLKQGGETFRNMVGKAVLPESFQVLCDPTLKKYNGQDLNGYYLYDSEGVKARRVNNVVNGVLKEFLMSRVPLDGFPQSNGHGRASGSNDPVSRQSNLIVKTDKPLTDTQLRGALIAECRKQGKEFGYYFKTVTSGYTMTGEGGSINSFDVTPLEVYRVYVDGRPDELVRGVSLIGTPLSMFSHIKYGGSTPSTFTGSCGAESGWVPVTASSPAIFVTQIETQRTAKSNAAPPLLPAPQINQSANLSQDDCIRKVMHDEMQRSMDSLHIANTPRTFWISYMTNRYRSFDITSEYGSVLNQSEEPWKTLIVSHVRLGNFRECSELKGQPIVMGKAASEQIEYNQLRRAFWQLSDISYKNSLNMSLRKGAYLKQNPVPSLLENIPDVQRSAPVTYEEPSPTFTLNVDELKNTAMKLSGIFNKYPHLLNASVRIRADEMKTYRMTTENVNLALPHNRLVIKASASFRDPSDIGQADNLTLCYDNPNELPSLDELEARVKAFADDCEALREAPTLDQYYKGPVMFEDDAVANVFTNKFMRPNGFYANPSMQVVANSLGAKLGKKIMDERITIRNLTSETSFEGKQLYGHYSMDADGFKPAADMVLVDKGVFKMMLNRATPAQYAEKSTASARFTNTSQQGIPVIGVGTLQVTASGATNQNDMDKLLIKKAKKQKLDYAYIISIPQNTDCLRLYRLNVKTGKRELLKANQIGLPTDEQMQKLGAISAESVVKNVVSPYTYSIIYPRSIIFDEMELNKSSFKPAPVDPIPYPLLRDEK